MNRLLIACLLLVALAGCLSKSDSGRINEPASATTSAKPDGQRRTLAYRHAIQIDTQEDKVATVHAAALAACREAQADLCDVLESRISTGRSASASLRFRARPGGIQKLIATVSKQADITDQSTLAEDLAGPIQDGEKKLAMLKSYRAELEALRQRAGHDVDPLIKVTHELAEVQSQLEAATGTQAVLVQRVETEILDITIRAERTQSFWQPISLATSDFGSSLSQGISATITGVAYLLPWGFILALAVWAVRKLWRRRKA